MVKIQLLPLAGFILVSQLAGAIGSLATTPAIPTWYASLNKPFFSPPNWLFAPVWLSLYTLMGIAAYLVWQKGAQKPQVRSAVRLFGIQLVFNSLWSIVFFGLRSPLGGLGVIVILWLLIITMIKTFYRVSRPAGLILIPYLIWVSFATLLNAAVWQLNY